MFPYALYKLVHILGIALALTALGGLAVHAWNGGAKHDNRARRVLIGMHGAGAVLVLVGGFGMLARLGFAHGAMFPGWLLGKLAVWAVLSVIVLVPYRWPRHAATMVLLLPLLALSAAWMAVYKPF